MLSETFARQSLVADVCDRLAADPSPLAVSGLWGSSAPMLAVAIARRFSNRLATLPTGATGGSSASASDLVALAGKLPVAPRLIVPCGGTVLFITAHAELADEAADDIETFSGVRPEILPAWELRPGEGAASDEVAAERTRLCNLLRDAGRNDTTTGAAGSLPVRGATGSSSASASSRTALADKPPVAPNDVGPSETAAADCPRLIVASIQALMQPVPTPAALDAHARELRVGQSADPTALAAWLADRGFTRLDRVEQPGDFALRGGILDVFVSAAVDPVRIEFFGDEIESIRQFDPSSNRSTRELQHTRIAVAPPAGSTAATAPSTLESQNAHARTATGTAGASGGGADQTTSFLKYLPADALICICEPTDVQEFGRTLLDRLGDPVGMYPVDAVFRLAGERRLLLLGRFAAAGANDARSLRVETLALPPFEAKAADALLQVMELADQGRVVVFCDNEGERQRLAELIEQTARTAGRTAPAIETPIGVIHHGFTWREPAVCVPDAPAVARSDAPPSEGATLTPALSLGGRGSDAATLTPTLSLGERGGNAATLTPSLSPGGRGGSCISVIGHHEIFHRHRRRTKFRAVAASRPIDSFLSLEPGDHVVHAAYGIAKFAGMKTIRKDARGPGDRGAVSGGLSEEFLALQFAGDAMLHVPANQIELVQKYVGPGAARPTLSTLGGTRWKQTKDRVEEAVTDFASDLLRIQAERESREGVAYPDDTHWQREFEAAFLFTETPDQLKAVADIKTDMRRMRPMDRLLCGDVGYGKTELAMRAAFKTIEYGKQVAVLVPTTVLAEQHYETFRERMADYPFTVERLSRFRSSKEIRDILDRARKGHVDVVIGTHRLLSKDVHFADLGLVVIDEEQRFGVEHKERLKQLRATVEVLTLTATPIPRTLHMAMVGLRDISALETPPLDRRSIVTRVVYPGRDLIREAVLRELNRDGQVFFVHNRVKSIHRVQARLSEIVPEARIVVGHGQMSGDELEDVMLRFAHRQADVLLCTSIIESGIDIPTANTIFIDRADMFGLAELHQLRGRVGRYKHRAFCYLLLPEGRPLTAVAARRLKAIEEFSELGSGFRIAMRDLEIRGAGNILGPEQSGHIAVVGYDMYCKLLEQSVRRMRGEKVEAAPDAHLELGLEAYVPRAFIPSDRQRMDVYRRVSACRNLEDVEQAERDIRDAYGEPPPPLAMLLALTDLRIRAIAWKVRSIRRREPDLIFTVDDIRLADELFRGSSGSVRVVDAETIHWRVPDSYFAPATMLAILRKLLGKTPR